MLDPDTAKTRRLAILLDAGFSCAAGIPFHSGGLQGIVKYYASKSPTSPELDKGTTSGANHAYLLRATDFIGAVLASIDSRRVIVAMKLGAIPTVPASPSSRSMRDAGTFHGSHVRTATAASGTYANISGSYRLDNNSSQKTGKP